MNTPRKMLSQMDKLKFLGHEWSMHGAALLATVFAWAGELIGALPLLITAIISAIINYRKYIQTERHREALHKKVLELIEKGQDVSGILKDED